MTTNYGEHAARIKEAHDRKLQRIRDRFTRKEITAELRDTLISRNTVDTRNQLTELRQAEQAERTNRRQTLERRLFAPNSSDGNDPATRAAAFRQARAEAAKFDEEGAIVAELRKAMRADDKLMAKALFERAHDVAQATDGKGLSRVIVAYLNEVEPHKTDDYRELQSMIGDEKSLSGRFAREATYLMPTPTEVDRYQDHRLPQLAADPRFADVQ
ncbi:hypothetical protein [Actinomadura rudentiformis]|uniref:Uncharacterized protein n=1 Tax=Actinomadura rudentiformis TaxID=359158 RepID=A0A6H9Y9R3_9ACTN|nr:hypothetical protein [Actinomadura rudentiformis]KAB2341878.1 hypothetical protein F8566_40585 [Actinomadura rudentiformis]